LVDALRERGLHAVIGGIALPNEASIALHERLGLREGRALQASWLQAGAMDRRGVLAVAAG
jgi:L-amino acid N-acyltransferase YncA